MNTQTCVGIIVIACSTLIYVGLYVWSARRINTIADKHLTSFRSILREFRNGHRSES